MNRSSSSPTGTGSETTRCTPRIGRAAASGRALWERLIAFLVLAVRALLLGIVGTTGVAVDDEDRSRSSSRPRTLRRLLAKVAVLAEQVQRRIQFGCLLEVAACGLPRIAFGEARHAH